MPSISLVVGSPAVGKSTTAHALAARSPRSLHIPVDTLRHMVVSGMAWPGADWSPELVEQIRLARNSAIYMAKTYSEAGFAVVLDDFWDPSLLMQEYGAPEAIQGLPGFTKIILYPAREVAEARSRKRNGEGEQTDYILQGIRMVYHFLDSVIAELPKQGWHVIDTTHMNVEETVDAILKINA